MITEEEIKRNMIKKYGDEYGLLIFQAIKYQKYEEAGKLRDEYYANKNKE